MFFVASDVWSVRLFHIMLTPKTCFLNLKHNLQLFCMMHCSPQMMPVNRIPSNEDESIEYASEASKLLPSLSEDLYD